MLLPKLVERTLTNAMKLQVLSAVDLRRREVSDAFVVMSIVVPIESKRTPVLPLVECHASICHAGLYFKVLNCDSEYALSLLVHGRECDCVIFISQRHCERCRDVIAAPRSAGMERPSGSTPFARIVSLTNMAARACFAAGKSLSKNTSAVQIKNDVEFVIASECGRKFGDVPSPNLAWSCCTKSCDLRFWMDRNSATFTNRLVLLQYSIHCSHRAQINALR
jgi:hypothetical protein